MQRTAAALSVTLLPACFPYQAASSGAVGCPASDIEIRDEQLKPGLEGPTRTWTAICEDRQHLCSKSGAGGAAECTEVLPREASDRLDDFRVTRGFDAQRKVQTIHARVRIDVRRSLELDAAPAVGPEVLLSVRLLERRGVPCDAVQLTGNGVALANQPLAARDEGPTYLIEARVGEDLLRELRRPHPTLTIEGCGQTLTLDDDAMASLTEFTRMVDDLAPAAPEASDATSTQP